MVTEINYDEFYDRPLTNPRESPNQFARYMVYRNMNKLERSVRVATELINEDAEEQVSYKTLHNTAHKFRWADRAKAYDTFLSSVQLTVLETSLTEAVQHVTAQEDIELILATQLMQTVLKTTFDNLTNEDPKLQTNVTDVQKVMKSMETLHTLRRRRAGMPTNFVTKEVPPEDFESMTFTIGTKSES